MSNISTKSDIAGLIRKIETNQLNGGRNTVKSLSPMFGFTIASARAALISHYGNRISFVKGRCGGIVIAAN